MKRVVVAGSLACDFVMRVPRRPQKGETVIGTSFDLFVGGKGNNQALACARAGGLVSMIGRVGRDAFGDRILATLDAAGVDRAHVGRDDDVGTGIADILVDAEGDNSICVAPQANGRLSAEHIAAASVVFADAAAVLLQLEIPAIAAIAAARAAKASGAMVILNPAPAPADGVVPPELLREVDVIIPNQTEAALLTGKSVTDIASAFEAVRALQAMGVARPIVTLGADGAVVAGEGGDIDHVAAFEIAVVDTTAAGDAFCGALAASLARGRTLRDAVEIGCAAGALACSKAGAEPSLPALAAIEALLGAGKRRAS